MAIATLKPGTLLKVYQHLKRVGIAADVSASEDQVTIRTREMTALYDMDEIVHLAQQAPTWKQGQTAESILW